jgi:hypothetical protein
LMASRAAMISSRRCLAGTDVSWSTEEVANWLAKTRMSPGPPILSTRRGRSRAARLRHSHVRQRSRRSLPVAEAGRGAGEVRRRRCKPGR